MIKTLHYVFICFVFSCVGMVFVNCADSNNNTDDFQPASYTPRGEVKIAHQYPHLGLDLSEKDNTFFSKEEKKTDYLLSVVVFPAIIGGVCFVVLICLVLYLCCR